MAQVQEHDNYSTQAISKRQFNITHFTTILHKPIPTRQFFINNINTTVLHRPFNTTMLHNPIQHDSST